MTKLLKMFEQVQFLLKSEVNNESPIIV